jgi:hypothetical protein
LEPLLLAEWQQVTVTFDDSIDLSPNRSLLVSPAEWSYAAHNDICLEEVRHSLANIQESLSEAALEERRERRLARIIFSILARIRPKCPIALSFRVSCFHLRRAAFGDRHPPCRNRRRGCIFKLLSRAN